MMIDLLFMRPEPIAVSPKAMTAVAETSVVCLYGRCPPRVPGTTTEALQGRGASLAVSNLGEAWLNMALGSIFCPDCKVRIPQNSLLYERLEMTVYVDTPDVSTFRPSLRQSIDLSRIEEALAAEDKLDALLTYAREQDVLLLRGNSRKIKSLLRSSAGTRHFGVDGSISCSPERNDHCHILH